MMPANTRSYRRPSGFTLIEILVALAVIAIAVAAVVTAVSGNVKNAAYIQDRTLAHWVAMNRVAELQVSKDWPSAGTQHGDTLMANLEWSWESKVSTTEDPDVNRIDVKVYADKDQKQVLASLVAYVGRKPGATASSGISP